MTSTDTPNVEIPEINFPRGEDSLQEYGNTYWEIGKSYYVNFYPNSPVLVQVVSITSPSLENDLESLRDGKAICLDLEWKPDFHKENHPIALFQFSSSKKVLIVLNEGEFLNNDGNGNPILKHFLKTNRIYGKGLSNDRRKLFSMFGESFPIEDIESTRIKPHHLPVSFSAIVETLVGSPVVQFKDKLVSRSNWENRPLTIKQILYASFDSYGMHRCYEVLCQRYGEELSKEYLPIVHQPAPNRCTQKKEKENLKQNFAIENEFVYGTSQQIHIRCSYDVKFTSVESQQNLLRPPNSNIFIPRANYSTQYSLLEHFYFNGNATKNDNHFTCQKCHLDFDTEEGLCSHVFYVHASDILEVYYPAQVPIYWLNCINQVILADNAMVMDPENKKRAIFKCGNCQKAFTEFQQYYSHYRMFHYKFNNEISSLPDLPSILLAHLRKSGNVGGNTCLVCNESYENEELLKKHLWEEHGTYFTSLWKHHPRPYTNQMYKSVFDLGIRIMNTMNVATMIKGIYACSACNIGFDEPGEVFIHLFHRHISLFAVRASDAPLWPLKMSDIPEVLQLVVKTTHYQNTIDVLCENQVLSINEVSINPEISEKDSVKPLEQKTKKVVHCNDCNIDFQLSGALENEQDLWNHLASHHILIAFTSDIKPFPFIEAQ